MEDGRRRFIRTRYRTPLDRIRAMPSDSRNTPKGGSDEPSCCFRHASQVADSPLLLLVAGFVLTSVVGGVLGYYFQQRTWRQQTVVQRADLRPRSGDQDVRGGQRSP